MNFGRLDLQAAELLGVTMGTRRRTVEASSADYPSMQRRARCSNMPHCQERKLPMRVIASTLLVCLSAASAALAEVPSGSAGTHAGSEPPMLEKKSCATLQYPIASLRAEETGRVVVQVTVGAEGQARFPRIIRPSGFPRLDDASVAYVLTCRFDRAGSGDAAADLNVIVPIEWRIESPHSPAGAWR